MVARAQFDLDSGETVVGWVLLDPGGDVERLKNDPSKTLLLAGDKTVEVPIKQIVFRED